MDFTIEQYKKLLQGLINEKYFFQTFEEFFIEPKDRVVVLRHDVDERPHNALKLARTEFELGIKATYYFRIVKISNHPAIIKKIAEMGHEIGYHYEDYASSNGDLNKAIKNFDNNLQYFRKYYPVKTVCMHGSSMSDYDNRDMWKTYQLADYGIIGEPYLSVDYSETLYLTDSGRCWDGGKYIVRDFVKNSFQFSFHKTVDIIKALENNELPNKIILQSHTLWTDSFKEWLWLLIRERTRNRIKMLIIKSPAIKKISYKFIQSYSK